MNDSDLRLEALRLANNSDWAPAAVVDRANAFYEFLIGRKTAAAPAEAGAALDQREG